MIICRNNIFKIIELLTFFTTDSLFIKYFNIIHCALFPKFPRFGIFFRIRRSWFELPVRFDLWEGPVEFYKQMIIFIQNQQLFCRDSLMKGDWGVDKTELFIPPLKKNE